MQCELLKRWRIVPDEYLWTSHPHRAFAWRGPDKPIRKTGVLPKLKIGHMPYKPVMEKVMKNLFGKFSAILIALAFVVMASPVAAQFTTSVGYTHMDGPVTLGAVYGSAGYEFEVADRMSVTPEIRVGLGVGSDMIGSFVEAELDRVWGPAFRFTYTLDGGAYFFATTSYLNYRFEFSGANFSDSVEDWEFGGGVGAGYNFTDNFGIEIFYEKVDVFDSVNAALRFRF